MSIHGHDIRGGLRARDAEGSGAKKSEECQDGYRKYGELAPEVEKWLKAGIAASWKQHIAQVSVYVMN